MSLVWVDLPEPRELRAAERDLLATLVGHASCAALAEQVGSVVVTGECRCGCASVRLRSAGPAVPADTIARLGTTGRGDHLGISTTVDPADSGVRVDRSVQVVVHVTNGLVTELEIFAGEGVAVSPPPVAAVHSVELV